jgi:hypothetical protein
MFAKFGVVEKAIRAQPKQKKHKRAEPYGYVTFEDPLVARKVINMKEIITDKRPILVESFTSNEITKLLQRLDRDPKRKNLSSRQRSKLNKRNRNEQFLKEMGVQLFSPKLTEEEIKHRQMLMAQFVQQMQPNKFNFNQGNQIPQMNPQHPLSQMPLNPMQYQQVAHILAQQNQL